MTFKTNSTFADNENEQYNDGTFKAHAFPKDSIPSSRTGSVKSTWTKRLLNAFMFSNDECWEITETDKGRINTVKDADNLASRVRNAAKKLNLPVSAKARMNRTFLIRTDVF